jgi:hypothetical protein
MLLGQVLQQLMSPGAQKYHLEVFPKTRPEISTKKLTQKKCHGTYLAVFSLFS